MPPDVANMSPLVGRRFRIVYIRSYCRH